MGLAVLPYFHAKQCWNTNVIHWSKKENMEIYHQIYRKSSDDVELLQNQEVCFHFDVGVKLQTVVRTLCIIFWNIFTRYRGEWSHDQMIVTSALEDSGLCSLTPVNGSYSDPGTCWRGSQRFMCCDVNHGVNTNRDVCLWWHFYKPLTMAEVNKSYEYIINRKNIPRLTGDYDYKIWSGY